MTISRFDVVTLRGTFWVSEPKAWWADRDRKSSKLVYLKFSQLRNLFGLPNFLRVADTFHFPRVGRFRFGPIAAGPLLFLCAVTSFPDSAAALELPSGVSAEIEEVLVEKIDDQNWVRFRLIAPEIDRSLTNAPGFAELEQDFPHLCSKIALPYLKEYALDADIIVMSIADRPVPFGVSDPDATQYFEQFRVEGGRCVWEGF